MSLPHTPHTHTQPTATTFTTATTFAHLVEENRHETLRLELEKGCPFLPFRLYDLRSHFREISGGRGHGRVKRGAAVQLVEQ